MSAFLSWRGIPPYVLGLARGVAAMMGILATFIFPIVHARLQTVRTGNWSIWIQVRSQSPVKKLTIVDVTSRYFNVSNRFFAS